MSFKEFLEAIALLINFGIGAIFLVMVIGIIVIVAFPELIQPRGYYRAKLRNALRPIFRWVVKQFNFFVDVLETLTDRQKLKETLEEIETGQRNLRLR